jgi:tetratricopeptide (TPR) repeat protein
MSNSKFRPIQLAEAHAALGTVYLWHDWNWAAADREIQRALQLNPDSVDALTASESYSLLVKARLDEASATSQRIVEVDPLNPFVRIQTIWVSFLSRRFDDSISHSKTLLELARRNWFAHFFLAMNYAVQADAARSGHRVQQSRGAAGRHVRHAVAWNMCLGPRHRWGD